MNTQSPHTSASSEGAAQDETQQQEQPAAAPRKVKKAPSAFRTISEVADGLNVQQHVLRFWETKFSQVRPLKRGGGRRYYRPEDVALLKSIHHLLYTEGYTIKGVQKLLKEQGKNKVVQNNKPLAAQAQNAGQAAVTNAAAPQTTAPAVGQPGLSTRNKAILQSTLNDLKEMKKLVG